MHSYLFGQCVRICPRVSVSSTAILICNFKPYFSHIFWSADCSHHMKPDTHTHTYIYICVCSDKKLTKITNDNLLVVFKKFTKSTKTASLMNVKVMTLFKVIIIIIIIIIIMSCRKHGYPWPSLAISTDRSLPLAGLQGYIPCPHTAAVCMFELVVLLLLGHMWGSIGVHHLWARPCFSSSVLHVWFV